MAKGRLGPGGMLAVDTATGEVLTDRQVIRRLAAEQPYESWLRENLTALDEPVLQDATSALHSPRSAPGHAGSSRWRRRLPQRATVAFGYNREELVVLFRPMWKQGR